MIKLNFSKKKVLIGAIAGTVLLGGTAFAANAYYKEITVEYAKIRLVVNGQYIPTKAEPFGYNGNVYAPVATIANALGVKQQWVNHDWVTNSPSVHFDLMTVSSLNQKITDFVSKKGPQKGDSDFGYEYRPLGGQVYLKESKYFDANELSLMDFSKKENGLILIPRIYTEQGAFMILVPGSIEMIDNQPNNLRFMVAEKTYPTKSPDIWVSTFEYKNGNLTKLCSSQIDEKSDVGSIVKTAGVLHAVEYSDNQSKSIGYATYKVNSDYTLTKQ